MDAAAHAELDALRLRAYGPSPDIADDADALSRLIELEELALPPVMPAEAVDAVDGVDAVDDAVDDASPVDGFAHAEEAMRPERIREIVPEDAHVLTPSPGDSRLPTRRPSPWHVGVVAAVAVFTTLLGMTAAAQAQGEVVGPAGRARPLAAEAAPAAAHPDRTVQTVIRVLINDSGDYVDLSSSPEVPVFPVNGEMRWAQPLGEYYGWALWIGGAPSARGDVDCLLLERESDTRSRCVSVELKAPGALAVSLPYEQLATDDRPSGMTTDQSVTFWWGAGGFIAVVLTATEPD